MRGSVDWVVRRGEGEGEKVYDLILFAVCSLVAGIKAGIYKYIYQAKD